MLMTADGGMLQELWGTPGTQIEDEVRVATQRQNRMFRAELTNGRSALIEIVHPLKRQAAVTLKVKGVTQEPEFGKLCPVIKKGIAILHGGKRLGIPKRLEVLR